MKEALIGEFLDLLSQTGFQEVRFLQAQTVDPKVVIGIVVGIIGLIGAAISVFGLGFYCGYLKGRRRQQTLMTEARQS